MTELRFLRHAHAGDPEKWPGPDAERPLSDKGRRQAERLGRLLASVDDRPDVFITSPKVRSIQTAQGVAAAMGGTVKVVEDPRLASPLDLATVDAIVRDAGDAGRPCLVGHDPDFSELLGELIGLGMLPMRKGAYARVDVSHPFGTARGQLRYLLPPDLIPER
jgi:phosphohistidine phosphatase SixA